VRRADRLFHIIQLLRGKRVVTATELAQDLEVSLRTIYRDVRDLIASGVPIEGEAGVGYMLPRGFDLPPLMFDEDEIEALVLGARMVQAWGDSALAKRAQSVLSKVESVLPERLKPRLERVALFVPPEVSQEHAERLAPLRRAVNERRKVQFTYTDAAGQSSTRTVRPVEALEEVRVTSAGGAPIPPVGRGQPVHEQPPHSFRSAELRGADVDQAGRIFAPVEQPRLVRLRLQVAIARLVVAQVQHQVPVAERDGRNVHRRSLQREAWFLRRVAVQALDQVVTRERHVLEAGQV